MSSATKAIENLVKSNSLPLGHVGRKQAQAEVDAIYEKAHSIQKYWGKKLKGFGHLFETPRECLNFCNDLCKMAGCAPVKKVVFKSPEVSIGAGAHCCPYDREIHFACYGWLNITIHELAHHVTYQSGSRSANHGNDFCFILDWLFQLAYEKLKGKKPNPYWAQETQKLFFSKNEKAA